MDDIMDTQRADREIGPFCYRNHELYCEKVRIADIVEEVGTPVYIYSKGGILEQYKEIREAFAHTDLLICYSIKANPHIAIIRTLINRGCGVDIVSMGELFRVIKAGTTGSRIVFAGVGKRDEEIRYALRNKILMFNVESIPELRRINAIAQSMNIEADIALRINPDVDAKTHKYITTGKKETKFGIPLYQVGEVLNFIQDLTHIRLIGLQSHIGSQILRVEPYEQALGKMKELVKDVRRKGHDIRYLNIGGGMGIRYGVFDKPFSMQRLAQVVTPVVRELEVKLILEPGRFIVGNNGIFVTKVLYVKHGHDKVFAITDGAMNDLIRPTLYSAYHQIWPLRDDGEKRGVYDIVGPVCESGDFFGQGMEITGVAENGFLAVMSAGAYGFAMASNYNSRPFPAEVMVSGDRFYVIRERPDVESIIEGENIPPNM